MMGPTLSGMTKNILLLGATLLLLILWLTAPFTKRMDLFFYDSWMMLNKTPVSNQVVVIGIDDQSLSYLGRWPWSRTVHAELIDRLTEAKVRAVGIDIIFSEPESEQADRRLAKAIQDNGRVVLALAPERLGMSRSMQELLPIPVLAIAAQRLGHVDVELDPDGLARTLYQFGGLGEPRWPSFSLALAYLTAENVISDIGYNIERQDQGTGWVRKNPMLIPYWGGSGHFKHYAYIDVLQGRVGIKQLKDKTVLIGATAVGMGDILSTPVQRMSGVEFNANIIESLIQQKQIKATSDNEALGFNLLLAGVFAVLIIFLPPRFYTVVALFGLVLPVALSYLMFVGQSNWFAPTNALFFQGMVLLALGGWRYQNSLKQVAVLHKQVYQETHFDNLTQLPNQKMLQQEITQRMEKAQQQSGHLALLVIQLGGIKNVNDRLGLEAGDQVLLKVAQQLQKAVVFQHPVARLGGAEFAVLLNPIKSEQEVHHMASRITPLLQQAYRVGEDAFYLTPSIGVSVFPGDGEDAPALLNNAYTAMHKAKEDKKCDLYFFSEQLKDQIVQASELERDLRNALASNQLDVYYQPQVVTESGEIIGMEALLRWIHPERGFISPADFIPIAEKTGLIIEIGNWVLYQACAQVAQWREERQQDIRIAVNVSAIQFGEGDLVQHVIDTLQKTGLPSNQLELEITESALINDMEATRDTLLQLRRLGVQIAIDDFGTGYSSLSYLQNFPLDRIKIDQSFVRDLTENSETAEITLAIISMAHGLKLKVIAEGVETDDQRDFLNSQTCEELQGYYFSRPLPASEVEKLLTTPVLGLKKQSCG